MTSSIFVLLMLTTSPQNNGFVQSFTSYVSGSDCNTALKRAKISLNGNVAAACVKLPVPLEAIATAAITATNPDSIPGGTQ